MTGLKWQVKATEVEGRIKSIYLVFDEAIECRETLHWIRKNDHTTRLLIDVDSNDLPIAMQIVSCFDDCEKDHELDDKLGFDANEAVKQLYAFAAKMTAFRRAEQESLGTALIKDALKRARYVAQHQQEPQAA